MSRISRHRSEIHNGKYYAQVTYEKAFDSKAEAERYLQQEDTRLTLEAYVDSISTSLWEPVGDSS